MGRPAHMLNLFRQKGLTSVVYGALIFAMVLVFLIGFNPTAGQKATTSLSTACAARVRGVCIEPKAHKAAFRLIFSRGTPGMTQASASKIVLEGLIQRELLANEAERLGLTVSESELTDSLLEGDLLVSLPADNALLAQQVGFPGGRARADFRNKETKVFDMKTYERNIKAMTGRSPAEFRDWQSRELLAAKMRDLVRAPVRVAEGEAFDRYVEERTTATVSYVVVRKNWVEKYAMATDPKDIDAWTKEKKNLLGVKTSVRHILVKYRDRGGAEPDAAKKDETKKKADEIYARLQKGEDFGKLAKEFSDDPGSKDKGGQYDAALVPQFAEEFQAAYNSLAPGETTKGPIEIAAFGWHIIKKDEASKEDLAAAYKATKSAAMAKQIAEEIAADLKAGKTGEAAVEAAIAKFGRFAPPKPAAPKPVADADGGAPAEPPPPVFTAETDPEKPAFVTSSAFNNGGDPIPAISADATSAVLAFAFKAEPLAVAEPIATDDGVLVVQLKERRPATREEFGKERDNYELGLLAAKQAEALGNYVRRLRESSKDEVKIDENNVFGARGDAGASQDEDE